jgi:hypothetical protein
VVAGPAVAAAAAAATDVASDVVMMLVQHRSKKSLREVMVLTALVLTSIGIKKSNVLVVQLY